MFDFRTKLRVLVVAGAISLALFAIAALGLSNVGNKRLDERSLRSAPAAAHRANSQGQGQDQPCPPQSAYAHANNNGVQNGADNGQGKKCGIDP